MVLAKDITDSVERLSQIKPRSHIADEAQGQAAVRLLELRRRILENIYELQLQAALRWQYRATREELTLRLEHEDLSPSESKHIRGRALEIDAKLWKSEQLSMQFELELQTFYQLLRP